MGAVRVTALLAGMLLDRTGRTRRPIGGDETMAEQHWPRSLWIVRHGESAGNVARDAADAAGLPMGGIVGRDGDVPLSPLGGAQARPSARCFAPPPAGEPPNVLLPPPSLRARRTADLICKTGGVEDGC